MLPDRSSLLLKESPRFLSLSPSHDDLRIRTWNQYIPKLKVEPFGTLKFAIKLHDKINRNKLDHVIHVESSWTAQFGQVEKRKALYASPTYQDNFEFPQNGHSAPMSVTARPFFECLIGSNFAASG